MKTIKTMLEMINKTFSIILSKMTNKLSKMLGFSKSNSKNVIIIVRIVIDSISMRYFTKDPVKD